MAITKTITDRKGQRLDNYLFNIYTATPNSHIYRMIRKGRIKINGKTCKDNTYKLQFNDEVKMPDPINPKKPIPSQNTIDIVKSMIIDENEDFWLLNKLPNFCVHHSQRDTFGIIEVMQYLYPDAQLVHRLDRNTTGCLLIAKNYAVLTELQSIWKAKEVKKYYTLLSHGRWKYDKTITISKPLLRLENTNQVIVSSKGKEAKTHVKLIKQYGKYALLEANIETGRTHQIRVHMCSIGYPIVGDKRYSDLPNTLSDHIFLHAAKLEFVWKGEPISLSCDLPEDKQEILSNC